MTSRPTIGRLMILVFVCAVYTSVVADPNWSRDPTWVIVALLVFSQTFPLLMGPVILGFGYKQSDEIHFYPLDPEDRATPAIVRDAYATAVARLQPLSFLPVGTFTHGAFVANTSGFTTVFKNDRTGEHARQNTVLYRSSGVSKDSFTLVFGTLFEDDTEVYTTNTQFLSLCPPQDPPIHSRSFPGLDEPATLLEVHRSRVAELTPAAAKFDAIGGDPVGYLDRTNARYLRHQVACGYYWHDEAQGCLRPTWKGAAIMSWRAFWLVKALRTELARRQGQALVRTLQDDRAFVVGESTPG